MSGNVPPIHVSLGILWIKKKKIRNVQTFSPIELQIFSFSKIKICFSAFWPFLQYLLIFQTIQISKAHTAFLNKSSRLRFGILKKNLFFIYPLVPARVYFNFSIRSCPAHLYLPIHTVFFIRLHSLQHRRIQYRPEKFRHIFLSNLTKFIFIIFLSDQRPFPYWSNSRTGATYYSFSTTFK